MTEVQEKSWGMNCAHAEKAVDFLHHIGLPFSIAPGASGFIPGIEICEGTLKICPEAQASNILHEAGHLAITPGHMRHHLSGDLSKGMRKIVEEANMFSLDPDGPLFRALIQMDDPSTTAWAWAAGKHLDLPEEVIIQDDEYNNEGADIRSCLSYGAYCGISGLCHAGFAVKRHNPYMIKPLPVYPELAFWLQP